MSSEVSEDIKKFTEAHTAKDKDLFYLKIELDELKRAHSAEKNTLVEQHKKEIDDLRLSHRETMSKMEDNFQFERVRQNLLLNQSQKEVEKLKADLDVCQHIEEECGRLKKELINLKAEPK
jgi:hypothetical protein